ncbi:MAG: response regulator [Cyclobacteriaceae bacterium]|nr:response regulator [Cyclobacteriaceae bacterium]
MPEQPTIALIDDDEIFQFTTTRIIQSTNLARVTNQFYNGQQALDFLAAHAGNENALPDILFLDINMPVIDGWMFLDEFRRLEPVLKKPITIFMVSSSIAPEDINRARSNPLVVDYLLKPLSLDNFKKVFTPLN